MLYCRTQFIVIASHRITSLYVTILFIFVHIIIVFIIITHSLLKHEPGSMSTLVCVAGL